MTLLELLLLVVVVKGRSSMLFSPATAKELLYSYTKGEDKAATI